MVSCFPIGPKIGERKQQKLVSLETDIQDGAVRCNLERAGETIERAVDPTGALLRPDTITLGAPPE